MNLEQITVKIRPRNQWEAIDMGIIIARKWFLQLWLLWNVTALPSILLIMLFSLLLPGSTPKWALIIFWLTKPLYEPPLLYWTSRALFGEKLSAGKTITEIKKTISGRRILSIWRYRLSPTRSFTFPILLLEGLTSKKRKKRSALLSNGYETAVYLSGAFFGIELILTLSLLTIMFWFIPAELRWIDFGDFIFKADSWLTLAAYFFICSIMAPFYICGGFILYISRRVELEAWDIEIGFKQIEQRLKERKNKALNTVALTLTLCLSSMILFSATQARADNLNPKTAKTTITKVLKQKDFGEKKTIYRWISKKEMKPEKNNTWLQSLEHLIEQLAAIAAKLRQHIGTIIRFTVWILAGSILVFILLKYSQISQWFASHIQTSPNTLTPPKILFGMDISPESLPDNIETACLTLLEKGEKRQALSLLYRGSLSRLVNDLHLQINQSYTEQECREVVASRLPQTESSYFSNLTAIWLKTAYGHHEPDTGSCRSLILGWQQLFNV